MAMLVIMNKGERVYESVSHSIVSNSLQPCGLQPTRLLCPWDCPGNKGIQLENKRNRFNLGPLIHPLALVCGKTFTLNTLIVKTGRGKHFSNCVPWCTSTSSSNVFPEKHRKLLFYDNK